MADVRDRIVADAKSVPQLVEAAKVADPDLFAALKGMPVWRLYGPPVTAIVAWLAGRYGLDWPADVCSSIALFLVAIGTGIVHWLKPTPVASLPAERVQGPCASIIVCLLALGSLSACATATAATAISTAIVAGQLFCAVQPGIVAVVNLHGQPVSVIGRTAEDVALFCAAVGGVPVPPPPDPAATPVEMAPAL